MLELRGCSVMRGGRALVQEVSLALPPGQVTVLVGPNGAGKSTLIRLLSGEIIPDVGDALIDGTPLAGHDPLALARRRAVLAQSADHAFGLTVRDLAGLGARPFGRAQADRIDAAVAAVGLSALIYQPVQKLSGGERQRSHLARVLVQLAASPPERTTLLLDEPLAAQDLSHQLHILSLARAHAQAGGAVCMVLHDLNCAAMVADHIVALHRGRIHSAGPPNAVITAPMLAEVFAVTVQPGRVPPVSLPFVLPQVARQHSPPAPPGPTPRTQACISP